LLSIGAMSSGSGRYYLELASENYYLKGGEPRGQWWGKGAEVLGLKGEVRSRALQALLKGYDLDGKRLTQNAGAKRRQPGWDLTFSVPKSVSTLWSQADEKTRHEIQTAHFEAVKAALSYLQDEVAFTRRGKGSLQIEPAKLIVATFEHGVSRELDPQLHTHALVMNASVRMDGTTGSILSKPVYQHKMAAGALYRAELAWQLERRLGVECERDKRSFALKGVPEKLNDAFSTRRHVVLEALQARGLESAAAAATATLATRRTKQNTPPRSALFAEWQQTGHEFGFLLKDVIGRREQSLNSDSRFSEAWQSAIKTLSRSNSHFDKKQILQHVAMEAQGKTLSAQFIRENVELRLREKNHIISLGKLADRERFTTPEAQKLEKKLIRRADAVHRAKGHGAKDSVIESVLKRYSSERSPVMEELKHHVGEVGKAFRKEKTLPVDRSKVREDAKVILSDEQKAAVRHLTNDKGGGFRSMEGFPGTGKTVTMRAAREVWESAGYRVIGVSVGGKASEQLEKRSGIESYTCAMLERLMHPTIKDVLRHEGRQLLRQWTNNKSFAMDKPLKLDSKTVLVIDEAGMCSTRQLNRLLAAARRGGAKVVALGDRDQLPAITAGGGFAFLADRYGKAELKEIVRQDEDWMKDAIKQLARGDAAGALKQFDLAGRLRVSDTRDNAISALVSDWAKKERGREHESLIFVGTRREAHDINMRCQKERLASKVLKASDRVTVRAVGVIDSESSEKIAFDLYRGDRVLLTKPSRRLGVKNGYTGTIIGIKRGLKSSSDILNIKLDTGNSVSIPLGSYEGVRPGYAVTTHKGQGTTTGRAYLLVGGSMTSKQMSHVQISRTVAETFIYTDKREAGPRFERLATQMKTDREKTLAHAVQAEVAETKRRIEAEERGAERLRTRVRSY
jgi:conjugative relaxase-like TrwC/TraI family protein